MISLVAMGVMEVTVVVRACVRAWYSVGGVTPWRAHRFFAVITEDVVQPTVAWSEDSTRHEATRPDAIMGRQQACAVVVVVAVVAP